jgi:hypothetical protein
MSFVSLGEWWRYSDGASDRSGRRRCRNLGTGWVTRDVARSANPCFFSAAVGGLEAVAYFRKLPDDRCILGQNIECGPDRRNTQNLRPRDRLARPPLKVPGNGSLVSETKLPQPLLAPLRITSGRIHPVIDINTSNPPGGFMSNLSSTNTSMDCLGAIRTRCCQICTNFHPQPSISGGQRW